VLKNNINLTKVMHKENKTTKGLEAEWDGRGQTTGQAQLDKKEAASRWKLLMAAEQVSQATRGQKRVARRWRLLRGWWQAFVTGNPLDKSERPVDEDFSADGGKAFVTGNPLDKKKASSQQVKITPRMEARQVSQATRWTKASSQQVKITPRTVARHL
jgi:hypothetical protein